MQEWCFWTGVTPSIMLQQHAAKKRISLIPKKQETLLTVASICIYTVEFVPPLYHHLQSIITHASRYCFLSLTKTMGFTRLALCSRYLPAPFAKNKEESKGPHTVSLGAKYALTVGFPTFLNYYDRFYLCSSYVL